jgi:hypothetical protein
MLRRNGVGTWSGPIEGWTARMSLAQSVLLAGPLRLSGPVSLLDWTPGLVVFDVHTEF